MITPPTTLPISVAEAKAHLRVTVDDDDALIEGYIRAALAHAEMMTGRAFVEQTWEFVVDAFPTVEIGPLTPGPVTSAVVIYIDADGFEQTVDANDYELDVSSAEGWVVPVGAWPSAMETINAIRVEFTVAPEFIPQDVKHAIYLLVGHFYNAREAAGAKRDAIPYGVDALLGLHCRIYI